MGDTDALRDKIAQAIHAQRCLSPEDCIGGVHDDFRLADAVLPVVQDHQWALREQADRQAQATINANITLSLLRSRVEALADELDKESAESEQRWRPKSGVSRAWLGDFMARRDAAQRLRRSLSDNKEQQQ